MLPIPDPFIAAELDYRRERIAADFAAANTGRRYRRARREARRLDAERRSRRPRAPRVASAR